MRNWVAFVQLIDNTSIFFLKVQGNLRYKMARLILSKYHNSTYSVFFFLLFFYFSFLGCQEKSYHNTNIACQLKKRRLFLDISTITKGFSKIIVSYL